MTLLTDALALTKSKTDPTPASPAECEHVFFPTQDGPDECCECGMTWAEAHRGFGSNVQPLSGRVKRVPRA